MNAPMHLRTLLHGLAEPPRDVLVTDLALDSRGVTPGAAFLACRGERHHGLDFLPQSLARGAAAVLWEPEAGREAPAPHGDVVMAAVPQLTQHASELADRFFVAPSRQLAVTGITGTNGKTTTAWLLAQAWTACGRPTAYVGTLGTAFGGEPVPGAHTTPDAVTVQRQLAAFRHAGAQGVAMEVSSHALAQARVEAVHFDTAIFTNLTRDHLDYHGTMERYGEAKARLLTGRGLRLAVCNADDGFGRGLLARGVGSRRIACSMAGGFVPPAGAGWLHARDTRYAVDGLAFRLESSFGVADVRASLVGAFNVHNLLATMAALLGADVPLADVVAAVRDLRAPPGRLETFGGGAQPLVVVDYAHTPDALENALGVLRQHCSGRLACVFGCGGERDRGKRPLMGAVAARLADDVVLTDDNPRGEAPAAILRDILGGIDRDVRVIPERGAAIQAAVAAAGPGDVVLVAGKGHEAEQVVGDRRLPFRDADAVRHALALRGGRA